MRSSIVIVVVVESAKETTAADMIVGADWCLGSAHGAVLLHSATSDAAVFGMLVTVLKESTDDEVEKSYSMRNRRTRAAAMRIPASTHLPHDDHGVRLR